MIAIVKGDKPRVATAFRPAPSPGWAERQRSARRFTWRMTRVPVLLLLAWFTLSHALFSGAWVFVDNVNLVMHEAGHVLFAWGPRTLHILGGTLGQLMWPVAFTVYFLVWKRQLFAAAACAWWAGENLANIARYIADAPVMELPLVGGDEHDWNNLLVGWGALHRASAIATTTRLLGLLLMLAAWAAMVLWTVRPREEEIVETVG